MNLIKSSINRPTAVLMFFLVILATGFMALSRLPLELTPQVDYPKLSVSTNWQNSSAEMIEAFVTSPIEAVAQTLTDVQNVDSRSDESQSLVNIELTRDANSDFAALELNEKLAVIRQTLPFGTTPPKIQKYVPQEFRSGEFLSFQLHGNFTPLQVRKYATANIRGQLLGVKGVAEVQVIGGQEEEIHIVVDEKKLKLLRLNHYQIARTLRQLSVEKTVGRIKDENYKFELVVRNPLKSLSDISNALILNENHTLIRLRDIASINHSVQEVRHFSRINGNPAIKISIIREPGTNTIEVANRVFKKIEGIKAEFPPSMKLITLENQSKKIRQQLRELGTRGGFSIFVIFLVLLLFLHRFRMPLIILSTIFFSVMLTFNLFYVANIGLNLLTLAGLSLGFGMLVDNAIVVLDSIHRHWRKGVLLKQACYSGTSAVSLAIISATLTTVVAFIPFLYLTGELRLYYIPFVGAVGFSLLSSLVVAFLLMPSLSNQLLAKDFPFRNNANKQLSFDKLSRSIYEKVLDWGLSHKFFILVVVILCFAGSYYLFDKYVTKGTIWGRWGADTYVSVWARLPAGADIKNTDEVARFFEEKLEGEKGVFSFSTQVTRESAYLKISFPDSLQFSAIPLIIKEKMTAAATQLAGLTISVYGFGPGFYSGGGGSSAQYRLKLLGYNYNRVKEYAEHVGNKLKRYSRVRDVDVSSSDWGWGDKRSELMLALDRDQVAKHNLSNMEVLQQLRTYLRENLSQSKLKIDGQEIYYRIKMSGYLNFTLEDLKKVIVRSPSGASVRLERLAKIEARKVLSSIVREDQQYRRWITFEYRGQYKLGDKLVASIIETTDLPPGYVLDRGRFMFMKEEEKEQIYRVLALSILLVFMVTASLFESLRQPFVVILSIPLALIGIFLIFYLTDTNFDRSAYIGVIFLSGIVVNNAIILVDHINQLRNKGLKFHDAIITGAADRVRPILMTTATTIFGLLPLVMFSREEKSMWFSLALATIGGLIASALFVLTTIPVLYSFLAKND
jgi:hydrophobic/amphiphilic exporter-1 (mainly G- bacteria), HAE1 family